MNRLAPLFCKALTKLDRSVSSILETSISVASPSMCLEPSPDPMERLYSRVLWPLVTRRSSSPTSAAALLIRLLKASVTPSAWLGWTKFNLVSTPKGFCPARSLLATSSFVWRPREAPGEYAVPDYPDLEVPFGQSPYGYDPLYFFQ